MNAFKDKFINHLNRESGFSFNQPVQTKVKNNMIILTTSDDEDEMNASREQFLRYRLKYEEEKEQERLKQEQKEMTMAQTDSADQLLPDPPSSSQNPRYLLPTVSSLLPPYTNGEIEQVKNGYRTGSYVTLNKLPDRLATGKVSLIRKQHILENLMANSAKKPVYKPGKQLKDTYFTKPEYIGTDFEKMHNLNKYQVDEEQIQVCSYSRKPFVVSSRIRSKFEDVFNDKLPNYPNLGPGGENHKIESLIRGDLNDEEQYIFGRFHFVQGKKKTGDEGSVKKWIKQIYEQLTKDWPDLTFRIKFTKSNEILIQFLKPANEHDQIEKQEHDLKRKEISRALSYSIDENEACNNKESGTSSQTFLPPNNVLQKYMQHLANHGIGKEHNLIKRGDRWNIIEKDYELLPPKKEEDKKEEEDHMKSILPSKRFSLLSRSIGTKNIIKGGSDGNSPDGVNFSSEEEQLNWFIRQTEESLNNTRPQLQSMLPSGLKLEPINTNIDARGRPRSKPKKSKAKPPLDPSIPFNTNERSPTNLMNKSNPNSNSSSNNNISRVSSASQDEEETKQQSLINNRRAVSFLGSKEPEIHLSSRSGDSHPQDTSNSPIKRSILKNSTTPSPPNAIEGSPKKTPKSKKKIDEDENFAPPDNSKVVYYLTFSFYAPWISSGQLNTNKLIGTQNRLQAKKFNQEYRKKFENVKESDRSQDKYASHSTFMSPSGNDSMSSDSKHSRLSNLPAINEDSTESIHSSNPYVAYSNKRYATM